MIPREKYYKLLRFLIRVKWSHLVGNKTKGRISKRVFQENNARQVFRKTNMSNPLIRTRTCAYQGIRNVRFFGKFDVLFFIETPVLRFALLSYYRRSELIRHYRVDLMHPHLFRKNPNRSCSKKVINKYVNTLNVLFK